MRHDPSRSFPAMTAALAAMALLSGGCGVQHHSDSQRMMSMYAAGDVPGALAVAETSGNSCDERDRLVWNLERGALLRTLGDIEASEAAFDYADLAIDEFDWQADVLLSEEFGATFTNLAALTYRGYAYDRIMLSTYRALNMMKLGDMASARVELNRALERQRDAIEFNRRRIEKAEEQMEEAREQQFVMRDDARPAELDELEELDIRFAELYRAQGDYVNPFTEFLHGLYFLHAGSDASDMENGRHAFERVAAIAADYNLHVLEDLRRAEDILSGRGCGPITYVIFETGRAPSRDQIRVDIPVPLAGIDYVSAAFPRLVFHHDHDPYLLVEHNDGVVETQLIADMDTIIGLEFANELPGVIARTIMNSAAQAAAHYGLHRGTERSGLANLFTRAGSVIYRAVQTQADRRTWNTLPKQIQYGAIPTPQDRTIVLRTHSTYPVPVTIEPGHVNIVYVKSVAAGDQLRVWQFRLR